MTIRVLKNSFPKIGLGLAAKAKALEDATAKRIAEHARATAPVSDDPSDPTPGSFRGAFRAESNRVVNDDPAAVYIEYGTSDTPTFATLRNATDAEQPQFVAELPTVLKGS